MNEQDQLNQLLNRMGLVKAGHEINAKRQIKMFLCRTFLKIVLVNLGCLVVCVATVACVILGCLKLFGVI
jgi:hypothetical protein